MIGILCFRADVRPRDLPFFPTRRSSDLDGDDDECNGGDPLLSPSQRIWGYETPDGSFAQFCRVQSRQNCANEPRSEEHTSELQSRQYLVCRPLPEKKKIIPK